MCSDLSGRSNTGSTVSFTWVKMIADLRALLQQPLPDAAARWQGEPAGWHDERFRMCQIVNVIFFNFSNFLIFIIFKLLSTIYIREVSACRVSVTSFFSRFWAFLLEQGHQVATQMTGKGYYFYDSSATSSDLTQAISFFDIYMWSEFSMNPKGAQHHRGPASSRAEAGQPSFVSSVQRCMVGDCPGTRPASSQVLGIEADINWYQ